ncbi:MAG: DUF3052 family protein [Usitatibacteraceae bacterium]
MPAPNPTAGYSGTPLPKKLGLKEGGAMVLLGAPDGIGKLMLPMPSGAKLSTKLAAKNDLVILFCRNTAALKKSLASTSKKLSADGSLWISWPKKSSQLFVDLTEDGIRAVVLPTGLVDVKVCAVNEDWSGLKLMVRKEEREGWNR